MRGNKILASALALTLVCGAVLGTALIGGKPDEQSLLAAADNTLVRTITVSGTGIVSAKPDTAVLNIGVQTRDAKAQIAQTANAQAMNQLLEALKKAGIAEKDMRTSGYSIWQDYSYANGVSKPNGYVVSNTLTVTVQAERVGGIIDQAGQAGANSINNIYFKFSDDSKLYQQAMTDAISNAKGKAQVLAGANGVSIGQVVTVVENSGGGASVIYMEKARATADMAAGTPIEAGTMDVTASVTVTYEIF